MKSTPIVVLDNGASTIKSNVIVPGTDAPKPRVITNAVVRQTKGDRLTFFGHEFDRCDDFASLHFRLPFERGYLTDWDAQKAIWDGLFSKSVLDVNTPECSLLITEPYFNLPNIQEQYDQFAFEEYEFQSYFRTTPACLMPYGSLFGNEDTNPPECMLIVDSGFSFTHIIPLMEGKVMWKSVRRLDVGGKLLTNHLKELLSYRQYDMMGETYVTNDIKEKCCYVSTAYTQDMEFCRSDPSRVVQEYVLPNFSEHRQGRVRTTEEMLTDNQDVVRMTNERFSVPEVLFRPTDIGLQQAGLSETIAHSIFSLPEDLQGLFWANIGLVGGNIKFPGFRQRLMTELRSLAPMDFEVNVYASANPITEVYRAGAAFARQPYFFANAVTRADYQEHGSNVCRRKFAEIVTRTPEPESAQPDEAEEERVVEKDKSRAKGKTRAKNIEHEAESGRRSGRGTRARTASNK